jgi:hypothetical protein
MPYITQKSRDAFGMGVGTEKITPGELNYMLTVLCSEYFKTQGGNYQAINDIVGALEGAKLEFYRRVAAPYEDKKIIENGDVY